MTPMRQKFVLKYCEQLSTDGKKPNATKAAIDAGYSEDTAGSQAHDLLKSPEIQAAIDERMKDLAAAAAVTPELVLRLWADVAMADPNELSQIRRVCCRHCYGVTHRYQWTEPEYTEAVERAIKASQPLPDGFGGFGFDEKREPNPACPVCHGEGIEKVHINDTRKLSPSARRLFAGVKKTKDGVQILTRDQDAATANLARYMGMYKDNVTLAGTVAFKPLADFYATPNTEPKGDTPGT